ncbi:MAG: 4-alpha-glucanotransferase [Chloroflexi bacterium ADurb.Bin325]|nr:MAG: 4-alpha-glucanotransferase [Chloroflexi bacterium ADurb.Bin325]
MSFSRSGGVLCHPTSFPGRFGIGDLGKGAHDFIDWLAEAGQQLWQVLPLGPTGYGDSPYQCFSAFAGNPLLISPESLAWNGLLPHEALADAPAFPAHAVDYGWVIDYKHRLFRQSYAHFKAHGPADRRKGFAQFRAQNADWLDDFALFMALKAHFGGGSWHEWPREVRRREPAVLAKYRAQVAAEAEYQAYLQFVFDDQWAALKRRAAGRGIQIIGDVPIFAAEDSADVWASPEQFRLDDEGNPTVVAGVPPDLFSATGQRWGNPHYDWDVMRQDGFQWWIRRIRQTLQFVDIVRIDHFRGFEASWEIPAGEPTAINGRWVRAPGAELFRAVQQALGALPVIAEDLGIITPEVDALRLQFGFPGMKVLHFAFGPEFFPPYLPYTYEPNCIVYAGTHDNNTTVGYWNERSEIEKHNIRRFTGTDAHDIAWDFIRLAWSSVANQAVATLQDVMSLGEEARMNYPSRIGGNWQWRYTADMLTPALAARLRDFSETYGRPLKLKEAAA